MPSGKTTKPSTVQPPEDSGFSPSSIQEQMERILNSPEFNATDAQREFLQYVVRKTLAGQADAIKGYAVATEVFGRRDDFDQATDPVVSIQANKLRRALERYYLVAGQNDRIRIDMPKGTYVPTFKPQNNLPAAATTYDDQQLEAGREKPWPSLRVESFTSLTGNPELDQVGATIAFEIALEITRCGEIHVFLKQPERGVPSASDGEARFLLNGTVNKDQSRFKVKAILTDLSSGRQIWADSHRALLNPAQLMPIAEQIAREVAGKISAEHGIIARHLTIESKRIPSWQLSTYEAILRFHEFNALFTRRSFFDAMEALQHASQTEPECGLVWSMLGRLYAVNYGTELVELDSPIDKAMEFAQTGVRLDPANQQTRLILAFTLMLADEIPAALAEADRALALNPESLVFLDNIGYMLTLLGDWQRGPALINKAIDVNPHYNVIVHYALWLDMFRRQSYEEAYLQTLNFRTPNLFWNHLAKAATLGHLSRIQEGRQAAEELLKLKPDFIQRGRVLIGHFVKFDEIVERLIAGLSLVGVDLDCADVAK